MGEVVVPDYRGWHAVEAWVDGTGLGLACQWRQTISQAPGEYVYVAEQDPSPGTVLGRGSIVALFLRVGPHDPGGGGVREPRRPLPLDRQGRGTKPLPQSADRGILDLG